MLTSKDNGIDLMEAEIIKNACQITLNANYFI